MLVFSFHQLAHRQPRLASLPWLPDDTGLPARGRLSSALGFDDG